MPKETEVNGNKETSEQWINLDNKFMENLGKICGPEVEKINH
jgi:hypothetical protein